MPKRPVSMTTSSRGMIIFIFLGIMVPPLFFFQYILNSGFLQEVEQGTVFKIMLESMEFSFIMDVPTGVSKGTFLNDT